MRLGTPLATLLVTCVVGCGASSDKGATSHDGTSADAGGSAGGSSGADPCGLHSGFPGDELCIPPPSADDGIQIHTGPTSYDDPKALAPYMIAAGEENVVCFNAKIPASDFYYLKQENRMRTHSHHMLIFVQNDPSLTEGPTTACDLTGGIASIPGSQVPARNFPDKLGDEDQGIGRYLPQATMATFQLHYVNTTTEPVLREAWVNLHRKPAAEVTTPLQSIFLVGDIGVNIDPHTQATTTLEYAPPITSETRIFAMNGHMHAHTQTFTVWRERGTDPPEQLYKSFDWEEPAEVTFNSVVTNPTVDEATKTDGAISGLLTLLPGDKLMWSCEVNNTLDTAIHFANQALTAEMCLLAGAYIGPTGGQMSGVCSGGTTGPGAVGGCIARKQ